jgi:cell division protein FtsB
MSRPKLDRSRIAVGAGIAVVAVVAAGIGWAFVQQLTLAQDLRAEVTRLERMAATEEARGNSLEDELAFVKTDEYVEKWAREEAKMARPGEVVVIPPADSEESDRRSAPTSGSQSPADSGTEPRPFWAAWWETIKALVAAEP